MKSNKVKQSVHLMKRNKKQKIHQQEEEAVSRKGPSPPNNSWPVSDPCATRSTTGKDTLIVDDAAIDTTEEDATINCVAAIKDFYTLDSESE